MRASAEAKNTVKARFAAPAAALALSLALQVHVDTQRPRPRSRPSSSRPPPSQWRLVETGKKAHAVPISRNSRVVDGWEREQTPPV